MFAVGNLLFLLFTNYVLAEQRTNSQKNKEDTAILDIELKDTILTQGLNLMTAGKYEKAVSYFENYLLFRMHNLDELIGLAAISFGVIPHKLAEGAEYFQKKIENNPDNHHLYYYKTVFEIMNLEIMNSLYDRMLDNRLSILEKYHAKYQKTHYILGLIYLLRGERDLYLGECAYLENKNPNLSKRLRSIYDKSKFLKKAIEEMKNERLRRNKEIKQE